MDFQGRTTVVTGAANGIGAALSRRFHAAGANVVLADRDTAPLERVTQELNDIRLGSAIGVVADIGTESGNIALINAARAKFGFIDLFYANAGIGGGTDLESTDEAMWEATFNINLNAHRWAAKHLLGEWLAEGRGYFCSTASAAGLLSQIGSAPYSVTKHGAVAFAEWLSITYGDRGLRVSCLCPQGVNTNLLNPPTTGDSAIAIAPNASSAIAPNASSAIAPSGSDVVKFAGVVLEPSDVAEVVYQAIVDERFLILPHPEVALYEQRKAADRDRWLAGMRKLQARVFGAV